MNKLSLDDIKANRSTDTIPTDSVQRSLASSTDAQQKIEQEQKRDSVNKNQKVGEFLYIKKLTALVASGVSPDQLKPKHLEELGGHFNRRKQIIEEFVDKYLDEDGKIIQVGSEWNEAIGEIMTLITSLQTKVITASRTAAHSRVDSLKSRLVEANELIANYKSSDLAQNERIQDLESMLCTKEELVANLTEDLQIKSEDLESVENDLKGNKVELAGEKKVTEMLSKQIQSQAEDIDVLQAKVEKLQDEKEGALVELNEERNSGALVTQKLEALEKSSVEQGDKYRVDMQGKQSEIESLHQKVSDLNDSQLSLNEKLSQANMSITSLTEQLAGAKGSLESSEGKVEVLQASIADAHVKLGVSEAELGRLRGVEEEMQNLRASNARLALQLEQASAALDVKKSSSS
ncbi:hypothetical protein A6E01_19940 (plasmid) [Vibrio breoganii]|uniref:KfrA N-terminal DNA-binding domain-containing protein n=1 Tax=Vibrio breoganii TaxID=553239 RepID=A0AAN0XZD7_9VIBR|nr:hypothetical protein [Vibrio breoganii]ANO35486.1 hypothetical protein A6E01_19940 [Vibrio breoganii]PML13801.1 hypothetical protein BCT84_12475 [Vibrio breoganii]